MFNNVRRISLFDEKSLNSTSSDTASMWNDFPSVPSDLPPLPADSVPSVPSLPSIASDVEVEQPAPSNYNYETHGIDEDHPGPDSERIVELQSDIHDKLGELMTNKSDQDVLSAAEALHGESNNIPFLEHLLDDLNKNGIEGEAYKDALDLSNRLGILPDKAALCDAAEPWQLGFQDAASPMMQGIIDLHHDIFFFLILILVFVSRILVRALWHFHYQKNPIPQRIVHGTTIEILRTIFPSIIPMFIAIPSFALLYSMDEVVVDPAITIKAIGHQWYRTYEYSDYNSSDEQSLTFDSYTIPEDDLELGQSRLLEVDNRVVVPAKTHLRIIVTPADVPHSWAVPSLGVKCDAVPGRLNQISISVQREGVYYGQCSEICGTNHAFTPIVVEAVPSKDYGSRVSNQLIPQTTGEA
ncbi:cytochrome c oxidase subunit 2 [Arachis hypogaea]|uniref:cytochrome c oxidase subunit 2-like n=1 Tax=Arachis hypogaea TaxID=3818 RepID=UPI0010FC4DAB|nr:uncharacterized protein LOC114926177 [Arachis hypogaea]XP_029152711.1 uncharacterized protein LOC114927242 [Arachis hypogaea]XP_029152785.1 uncharacterized protein LOC114927342 [Arachis hypogaea]